MNIKGGSALQNAACRRPGHRCHLTHSPLTAAVHYFRFHFFLFFPFFTFFPFSEDGLFQCCWFSRSSFGFDPDSDPAWYVFGIILFFLWVLLLSLDFLIFTCFFSSNFPLITKSYFSYSLTFPRQCVCLRRVSFWFPTNHPIPFSSLFDFSPLRVFSHVSSNHLVSCEIKTNSWFLLLLFKFPPRRLVFNFPLITQSSYLPLSCTSWFPPLFLLSISSVPPLILFFSIFH